VWLSSGSGQHSLAIHANFGELKSGRGKSMEYQIRTYIESDIDAIVELSLLAWEPVFSSSFFCGGNHPPKRVEEAVPLC
jgi:hypothetical protein